MLFSRQLLSQLIDLMQIQYDFALKLYSKAYNFHSRIFRVIYFKHPLYVLPKCFALNVITELF